MKRLIIAALLSAFALPAFPHAGEVHTYMGTIAAVAEDGSFTFETTKGEELRVATTKDTKFVFADGSEAAYSDLEAGARAVVTMAKDAKTATSVKLGARKKEQ